MFQIDIINPGGKQKTYQKFVEEWTTFMQQAFTIANEQVKKASKNNKQYYDKKVKETEIQVGDNVLIRNVRERGGTGKLRSYWESSIFEVIEKDENLPV